jgi:hypothetical protein
MEEITKKAKAPAKPRKTTAKKTTNPSNVTEMPSPVSYEKAPASQNGVAAQPAQPVSYDKVAELAHRFWNERGRQHGHHVEDWFRAEQELRGKAS